MALRSWLIRGIILAGLAALAVAGWVASSWVSPDSVRAQVLAHLNDQLVGVEIHLGSARMRIFGGIAVTDLRLVRHGESSDHPFCIIPSAVLYHDKEQLNRGRLAIRKIEMDNPEVWLERAADGTWNLLGIARPSPADKPVPIIVASGATLHFTDHGAGRLPPVTLTNARFSVMNQPLPVIDIDAEAGCVAFGPIKLLARLNRLNNHLAVKVELAEFPLRAASVQAADRFAPDLAGPLAGLTATAAVKAELNYAPDATPSLHHDIHVEIRDGRFEHPTLPWPLDKIEGTARIVDGRVKVERASAKAGPIAFEMALETRDAADAQQAEDVKRHSGRPAAAAPKDAFVVFLRALEEKLQRLKLVARGVPLDDHICGKLPGEAARKMKQMFQPSGAVDATYEFAREPAGWRREYEFRPKNLGVVYEKFRYPVGDVRGWVRRTVTHAGQDNTLIKLYGTAGGQPITIDGQVYGDGDDPAVSLRIVGTNVPIDETLFSALPGKYPNVVREFRAGGRGDFVAEIKQQPGVNLLENAFTIDLHDATVNYKQFPYPLEKVNGRVIVRTNITDPDRPLRPGEPRQALPDRDEIVLQNFTAAHGGGLVKLHGDKRPAAEGSDKKLSLHVSGTACPIDGDLRAALAALKLDPVWTTFSPTGSLTFNADVEILDRGPTRVSRDAEALRSGARALSSASRGPEPVVNAALRSEDSASRLNANKDSEGPPFDPTTDLTLTFNFLGPTVVPTFFPYEMTELSGRLEYKNGKVDLDHFAGRHGESRLNLATGDVRFYPDGVVWAELKGLEVKPFAADSAMLKALPGRLQGPVDDLKLRGAAELNVKQLVVQTPPERPAAGKSSPPALLPLAPAAARGQSPSAAADDPDPVVYWDAELRFLGASLEVGLPWEEVIGAIAVRGRYDNTHLGAVRGNLWLDQASIAKQPVTQAKVSFRAPAQAADPQHPGLFLPPFFEFQDFSGTLFHGSIGGEARVVLAEPTRYEIWLTATDVRLDEVAQHYKLGSDADLKGVAQAQVWFANRADPRTGKYALEGTGKVDVPTGRMYNLPVLLDLVKVLKLQAPDKTAFEEAHAAFRFQGDRVKVDQLDLIGAAVCLGGSGELDTKGDYVRFEFYTIWSQLLKRWLTTPVGDLSAFFSRNLFKIKMTRKDGKLTYEGEIVPLVTDPAKKILERMKLGAGRLMGK